MKNIEQLLNKENWIKYLELADQGGITNHGKAQDIVKEIEEAINYSQCCKSVKGEKIPTFDEFIDKFNLEADRDNEYFFDDEYFDAMGLYYKYAEHYGINP